MNRRGFTLFELVMALMLSSMVAIPVYAVLITNQRTYREQIFRADLNANTRAGTAILSAELRTLDAGDPAGSDIMAMSPTAVTYKAMRSVALVCADPNPGTPELLAYRDWTYGLRAPDPGLDSLFVFADFDKKTRFDDQWLHADLTGTNTTGPNCPDGSPSLRINLAGVTAADLRGVHAGAPVRSFEIVELSLYQAAPAEWWLGARLYDKANRSWSGAEPLFGPLTGSGLELVYYDATGAVTANRAAVARIGLAIRGRTAEPVHIAGTMRYAVDSLVTDIVLRNNPRF